ncbi:CDP-diacylglycerol--glycerol-3-phosphate 3-phosphatidyltransferase [Mycoplasma buteonis]|uniref:CDP-diacylglycerol--glycerol-3-phosphate 3-phosphatidyltransferase n=1 Tax=Mycoplasma buteonis TaxID=171280 RepID=UPI00055B9D40|nr:CDP-diacylglycerol--glycerol-3-phosphate 3-phosphatidyltransferase [Mycoplasma buteonis]
MKNLTNKVNLPNLLTIFRLVLIIPLLFLMSLILSRFFNNQYFIGAMGILIFIIFIVAMITDFLDGYLARKNNQVSEFGKLWDPIADKVITNVLLVFLAVISAIPFWVVVLFIIRDLAVAGFRNVMSKHNIDVQANKFGKIKTLLLSIGIGISLFVWVILKFTLFNHPLPSELRLWNYLLKYVFGLPIIIALGFSLFSGYQYFMAIKPYIFFNK